MKKSKIIIPALGMLLLSTAASISGTVAWFTTVSTANARLSSFAVRKLGGDLALTVKTAADGSSYGVGTKKDANNVVLLDGNTPALCDASYKHTTTASVYKANSSATEFSTVAESGWKVTSNGVDTYYAVSWTLEFDYTFGGDTTNVNLYYDLDQAILTPTAGTTGDASTGETWKGFRIAFICGSRTLVWAGGHTSSEASGLKYQGGTAVANATTYVGPNADNSAGELVTGYGASGTYAAAIHAGSSDSALGAARADYIGTFTSSAHTLSVKCIAWYEGNDANVKNGARMDEVAATMAFYTRTAA